MTEQEVKRLLAKYEQGTCSKSEKALLDKFFFHFQGLENENDLSISEEQQIGKEIYQNISENFIDPEYSPNILRKYWMLWIILLLIFIAGAFWIKVSKGKNEVVEPLEFAKLETRANERKNIVLSDGTKVEINENTTLTYPVNFQRYNEKVVELNGQAFFDVISDSIKLFKVKTDELETTVLGTSFVVNATPQDQVVSIGLVKGKLRVTQKNGISKDLSPGEQVIYSKSDSSLVKSTIKGNLIYAWKEDIILFENATVEEVVKVISSKYNVTIHIENPHLIMSRLVYRINIKEFDFQDVINHITKVTTYKFVKNPDGSYTVNLK